MCLVSVVEVHLSAMPLLIIIVQNNLNDIMCLTVAKQIAYDSSKSKHRSDQKT